MSIPGKYGLAAYERYTRAANLPPGADLNPGVFLHPGANTAHEHGLRPQDTIRTDQDFQEWFTIQLRLQTNECFQSSVACNLCH